MSVAERRCYSGKNRQAIVSMTDSTRENRALSLHPNKEDILCYTGKGTISMAENKHCVMLGRAL